MSPKSTKDKPFMDNIDLVTLYISALLSTFLISLIPGLNKSNQFGGIMILMVMILGLEMFIRSILQKPRSKKPKHHPFLRSEDVKLFDIIKITPYLLTNFIIAFTSGGIIGYAFLEPTFIIFVASGLTLFSIIIGCEWVFNDSFSAYERLLFKHYMSNLSDLLVRASHNKIAVSTTLGTVLGIVICVTLFSTHAVDILKVGGIFCMMSLSSSMVLTDIC